MIAVRKPPKAVWLVAFAILAASCRGDASPSRSDPELAPVTSLPPVGTTALPPVTTTTAESSRTTTGGPELVVISEPLPPAPRRLVISGTGDVNLDPTFVRTFPEKGYEYAWTGLGGVFLTDDLTIVNLECSASRLGTPWDKPYTFRCDPDALPSMADAGVEVANLANNHSIDYGFEAMLDARQNLIASGIVPVGAGKDAAEAYAPALFEING